LLFGWSISGIKEDKTNKIKNNKLALMPVKYFNSKNTKMENKK
jgi:hypothetical protein